MTILKYRYYLLVIPSKWIPNYPYLSTVSQELTRALVMLCLVNEKQLHFLYLYSCLDEVRIVIPTDVPNLPTCM